MCYISQRALSAGLFVILVSVGPVRAQLSCSRPSCDFGTVAAATSSVPCAFQLQNTGTKPLTIEDVHVSCGCMVSDLRTPWKLASGSNVMLTVQFDVRPRSGMQRKSVHISYRERKGDLQVLTLSVCGTVIPAFRCEPAELDFGPIARSSEPSREIVVSSLQGAPFELREVYGMPSQVVARAVSEGRATRHVVRVSLRGLNGPAPWSGGTVRIETDAAIANVITCDVRANPVAVVASLPPGIFVNPGDVLECRLRFTSPLGRPFQILGVDTTDPRLRATLMGTAADPEVLVLAVKPVSTVDGQCVRVRTNLKEWPVVEVPVHVVESGDNPVPGR